MSTAGHVIGVWILECLTLIKKILKTVFQMDHSVRWTADALAPAEEVLITKSDLEETNNNMQELKTKVEELTMQNEYQMRLKELNYQDKPVGLLNHRGFWDHLVAWYEHASSEGFIRPIHADLVLVDTDGETLLQRLAAYDIPAVTKWASRDPGVSTVG